MQNSQPAEWPLLWKEVVGLLRCVNAVLNLGPWPQLLLVASGSGAPHTQEQLLFYSYGRGSAITAHGRKPPKPSRGAAALPPEAAGALD